MAQFSFTKHLKKVIEESGSLAYSKPEIFFIAYNLRRGIFRSTRVAVRDATHRWKPDESAADEYQPTVLMLDNVPKTGR